MLDTLKKIRKKTKEGMLKEMWQETKWLYLYVRRYWKHISLYTLMGAGSTLISFCASLSSRDLVDVITGYQTGKLVQTFIMLVAFTVTSMLLNQITSYASKWLTLKVDTEIKADIFEKMLTTDWESITNYHTGDLLTRWNSDASNISNGVLNWVPSLILNCFRFIGAFSIVFYNDPTFLLFALIGVPVSMLMSRTLMRRMRNNNQRSAAMGAKVAGFNQEAFSNLQTIKAFDLIRFYIDKLKNLQTEYIGMQLEFQRMSIVTSIIMALTGMLVSYSSYGWGIYRVWSGAISYGTMTLFLSMASTLTSTLNSLISLVPTAISITTSAGRLMAILEMPKEDDSARDEATAFMQQYGTQGIGLQVSKVHYSYQNGTPVFTDISLEANPRELIALVGPSGEGKTTMLRLILALLHPQEGEISLYPGEAAHKTFPISPATRQLFSYVPQGNTLFSGTIAENMRSVKPDVTEEEIVEALKKACAWGFVSTLPLGIHSPVKERGGGFSEGQAQRLSIARSLLRQSPILLLDEATSALDVATERQILKNILEDTSPRTCIVTTHRPTVLNLCNRVYRLGDSHCQVLNAEEVQELITSF